MSHSTYHLTYTECITPERTAILASLLKTVVLLALSPLALAAFSPRADVGDKMKYILERRTSDMPGIGATSVGTVGGAGLVPLSLSEDKQTYYALATVGGVPFRFALDTGSADTWLLSTSCTSPECAKLPRYPLNYNSSTFMAVLANSTSFNATYADTTHANGIVAIEEVKLSNVSSPKQYIGLVNETDVSFTSDISGVLGLSFPRLSTIGHLLPPASPFIGSLVQQGLLSYALFGLSLTRDIDGGSGSLALGAVDSSVLSNVSQVSWNSVWEFPPFLNEAGRDASGYLQWVIQLDGVQLDGMQVDLQPSYPEITRNASLALLDVGFPGIIGPWADVTRIYSGIPYARLVNETLGQWAVPCTTSMILAFKFGQMNFILQPTDYFIGPASGTPDFCLTWPRSRAPSADGIDWSFGQVFLVTVYSIWSYGIDGKEAPLIGFFPLSNSPAESPEQISSFLSSASATIASTLPYYLTIPSPTTPAIAFNTFLSLTAGAIVSSELGVSTYTPLLANTMRVNASAFRTLHPEPTVFTLTVTDAAGTHTTLSHVATPMLGQVPRTSNSASSLSLAPKPMIFLSFLSLFWSV